ncbi:hypothetical protein DVK85_07050 [Flavobacterium arcticum]|uniref:Uncharacterized protein n=1 Tax=Flavobacterium arcticum TaxID=1784713 RepID=A0A345HBQ3_9FLAO|nr:hypothetical protein [Flavobacterium arcticum]AXG74013.1 hypothetical protein DVK85_07050 [Flavobacterium arcticum]KAF2508991.1 hypothetical protein E0W72_10535 [Flavobacterium arcticum]
MKKLLLSLFGIFVLASCSNDTEESVTFNEASVEANSSMMLKSASADPVLKQLYIDRVNSQSYIDFDNAIVAFNDKLGTTIPDSEMDSSNKMLGWVQNNITQTGFLNYQEAEDKWDNVETLSAIELNANYNFHDYLAGTTPGTLLIVIEEVRPVISSCKECYAQFLVCSKAVNDNYTGLIELAVGLHKGGYISNKSYSVICAEADLQRIKGDRKCHETMDDCCTDA